MRVPGREAARAAVEPSPELAERIRAFLADQLGGVLPPDPARGLDWYYDWVVLGERSLDALQVFARADLPGERPVVDVGSGLGTFVLLANECGLPAIGVEPGPEEIALARERAGERGTVFHEGVGEALPLGDGEADGALLHDVLEHVRDWRAVLRECRRVVAPGGAVYVKGPSYAVRFSEPHYRVAWLPLLPRPIARRYLRARGRDVDYFEHLGYRRRGEVLSELRALGFALEFPRLAKFRDPARINRAWVRRLVEAFGGGTEHVPRPLALLAESPLQSTIDVVARVPPTR